jgi:Uncharacterized ACR, COG1678
MAARQDITGSNKMTWTLRALRRLNFSNVSLLVPVTIALVVLVSDDAATFTPQYLLPSRAPCVVSSAFGPTTVARATCGYSSLSQYPLQLGASADPENYGKTDDTERDDSVPTEEMKQSASTGSVRFLGKGERAIVRPGVVLLAPSNEFHHYYRQAAIFIHAMGEDEFGVFVVRGVIIDHPTPFTLAEMMPDSSNILNNPLGNNFLFRGGDKGGEGVVLLHNKEHLGQSVIGVSGVYQGGWEEVLAACAAGEADVNDFKLFFNYCEFTEVEIADLLKSYEDGDCWASVEVSTEMILDGDWDRGDCWRKLRNAISPSMRA